MIATKPKRIFSIFSPQVGRFCVASDAALEVERGGTGGFLLCLNGATELREACVSDIPDGLYDLWFTSPKKIVQLELSQVLFASCTCAHMFRERRGI